MGNCQCTTRSTDVNASLDVVDLLPLSDFSMPVRVSGGDDKVSMMSHEDSTASGSGQDDALDNIFDDFELCEAVTSARLSSAFNGVSLEGVSGRSVWRQSMEEQTLEQIPTDEDLFEFGEAISGPCSSSFAGKVVAKAEEPPIGRTLV